MTHDGSRGDSSDSPAVDDRTTVPSAATPVGLDTRRLRAAIEARLFGASQAPTHIGRFVVLERLGEGGMGTVWAAWDPELDRRVAIKVTRRRVDRERSVARMRREARALARLDHPNVVTVHEVDVIEDHLYIAMELVRGGTLGTWCEEHPRDAKGRFAALLDLAIQAARGLSAVHSAGMVHRDLKPSNMLVDERGRLCLTDFGLARLEVDGGSSSDVDSGGGRIANAATGRARQGVAALQGVETVTLALAPADERADERAPQTETQALAPDPLVSDEGLRSDHPATGGLTRAGEILGTPAYMAPEQLEGRADALADQFSLCATLWEAAYGVRPFSGLTPVARLEAIEDGRPALPTKPHDVPAWFRAVLRRGLAYQPAQRWPDIPTLLRALERGRGRRRERWLLLGGALVLVGVAGWVTWTRLEPGRWCGSGEEAMAVAWGPERRAAIAQRHEPEVVAALQANAAEWSETYERVCHAYAEAAPAARDGNAAPLQAGSERLACLADAREQLATVADELATKRADDHPALVRALPSPADCEARDLVPTEPLDLARLTAAPVLGRARVLLLAGRLDATERILDEATSLYATNPAVAGPLEELRAGVEAARGEHAEAQRRAERALGLAERAGDRETTLRAWLRLHAAAVALGEHERAQLCAERVASLARRNTPASLRVAAEQAAAVSAPTPAPQSSDRWRASAGHRVRNRATIADPWTTTSPWSVAGATATRPPATSCSTATSPRSAGSSATRSHTRTPRI